MLDGLGHGGLVREVEVQRAGADAGSRADLRQTVPDATPCLELLGRRPDQRKTGPDGPVLFGHPWLPWRALMATQ
ncbi:pirin, N-terminal [Streptomyces azureus]|uniref:Pirin, N-terminal n=1 Tax=Streptomyces azureus TaxID=146537 RepID=A0A0K8PJK9_STRAJ|nr:pirin, N-terminal [Streptomyces azureus]